ncbi:hypothetical protein ONZ45_g3908 [Pleurotus djamor]|nr:hypothetical protein ONZ45_g3908 [Pleurotus djamor]
MTRVQSIAFPPHHADPPEAPSPTKCKGFAFVVLTSTCDVDTLLERWPWNRDRESPETVDTLEKEAKDAAAFGFRAISKTRWEEMKNEYLAYREELIERMNDESIAQRKVYRDSSDTLAGLTSDVLNDDQLPETHSPSALPSIHPSDPYPANCLVFVKNIHPGTNKTTLRNFFAQAFQAKVGDGIDYVDFNKGMDSCYLRLSSPHHTSFLATYFAAHDLTQQDGLDAAGTPANGSKAVQVEQIEGKREAVYWEKVPEKVRRGAVERAIKMVTEVGLGITQGAGDDNGKPAAKKETRSEANTKKRKR